MHLALRHGLACGALAYPMQTLMVCLTRSQVLWKSTSGRPPAGTEARPACNSPAPCTASSPRGSTHTSSLLLKAAALSTALLCKQLTALLHAVWGRCSTRGRWPAGSWRWPAGGRASCASSSSAPRRAPPDNGAASPAPGELKPFAGELKPYAGPLRAAGSSASSQLLGSRPSDASTAASLGGGTPPAVGGGAGHAAGHQSGLPLHGKSSAGAGAPATGTMRPSAGEPASAGGLAREGASPGGQASAGEPPGCPPAVENGQAAVPGRTQRKGVAVRWLLAGMPHAM